LSDSTSSFPPPAQPERTPGYPSGQSWEQAPPPPSQYGYDSAPAPGYGYPTGPEPPYAHWLYRVGSFLVDWLIFAIPATIGSAIANLSGTQTVDEFGVPETTNVPAWAVIVSLLFVAASIALFVWNICLRQGRTGQSLGKQLVGTKLVSAQTGQPIGGGMAFARYLCHIIDALPCYLGYLWPLWDRQRQTFADKIVNTFVIRV
jgi:uncharacterized RDD family membrane protein YckC